MRNKGKIKSWKDDKGYGFVSSLDDRGNDVFLHVSSFHNKHRKPKVDDIVTYEIATGKDNRLQAVNVLFAGEKISSLRKKKSRLPLPIYTIFVILIVGYIGYLRLTHPNSTISSSADKAVFARNAINNQDVYRCEGKKYCSEMTSCSEALFYQENCPGTKMDGDHDGIPCEQQWCD